MRDGTTTVTRKGALKLLDYYGKPVRDPDKLFMMGVMCFQAKVGQPTHIFDCRYDSWDNHDGEEEFPPGSSLYMKWIGVCWYVELVLKSGAMRTLFKEENASDAFRKMREVGDLHSVEVDDRIRLPSCHAAETDMMREVATESMAPKFFVCGDALDRREERYVREGDPSS